MLLPGFWWEKMSQNTKPPIRTSTVWFDGDPSAISKKVPIFWRFAQDWHSLLVGDFSGDTDFSEGYYIFFCSGGETMKFRRLLTSRYVMVRVGPSPVNFWVKNELGCLGELSKTGVRVPPGNRFYRNKSSKSFLQQTATGSHTWV